MTGLIFIEPILGIYQQIEMKLDWDNELSNQLSCVYLLQDHTESVSSWDSPRCQDDRKYQQHSSYDDMWQSPLSSLSVPQD